MINYRKLEICFNGLLFILCGANAVATAAPANVRRKSREAKSVAAANRLSMGVLTISILFLMVPSTLVGITDFFGIELFAKVGPFYIFGLLLAGGYSITVKPKEGYYRSHSRINCTLLP